MEAWRSEVAIRAAESTEQLLDLAGEVGVRLEMPYQSSTLSDIGTLGAGLADAATHPGRTGRAIVDWDTWRQNPPRAIGHVLPDLALALAGGGVAGGARAAEIARRGQRAVTAGRDLLRRSATAEAAREARQNLVRQALIVPDRAASQPWRGEAAPG